MFYCGFGTCLYLVIGLVIARKWWQRDKGMNTALDLFMVCLFSIFFWWAIISIYLINEAQKIRINRE